MTISDNCGLNLNKQLWIPNEIEPLIIDLLIYYLWQTKYKICIIYFLIVNKPVDIFCVKMDRWSHIFVIALCYFTLVSLVESNEYFQIEWDFVFMGNKHLLIACCTSDLNYILNFTRFNMVYTSKQKSHFEFQLLGECHRWLARTSLGHM